MGIIAAKRLLYFFVPDDPQTMRASVPLAYYTFPTLLKKTAPEPAGGQAMTQYTARLTGAVPFNLQETFEWRAVLPLAAR